MDKKIRETLSFLARMIDNANNNPISVPDMDRLKRIGDGTAFKDEQDEQEESRAVLDLNGSLHRIPVLINGTAYLAYVSAITQEKTGSIAGTDLFVTKIELTAPYVPFISRK